MILRTPAEDENGRSTLPERQYREGSAFPAFATRFALLGESEGDAVFPSSDLPRSRIEGEALRSIRG